MIKIEKILTDGRLLGLDDEWYYLYKAINTETQKFWNVIAKQKSVEMSPTFDKQIRQRIRYKLKNKEKK